MELFLERSGELGYCSGEDLSSRGQLTHLSAYASESKDSAICKHCLAMPNIAIIMGYLVVQIRRNGNR